MPQGDIHFAQVMRATAVEQVYCFLHADVDAIGCARSWIGSTVKAGTAPIRESIMLGPRPDASACMPAAAN